MVKTNGKDKVKVKDKRNKSRKQQKQAIDRGKRKLDKTKKGGYEER